MPDNDNSNNENKLSIAIEATGALKAIRDLNRVDKAQKAVAKSAKEMQEAQAGGGSGKKPSTSGSSGGGADKGADKVNKDKEKQTKKAAQDTAKFSAGIRNTAMALAGLSLVIRSARHAIGAWNKALTKAGDYYTAGELTGLGSDRIQRWKWTLARYGGGDSSAVTNFMSLQRNLEMARRGENPWGQAAYQYLGGNMLSATPGMTLEEFLQRLAPELQKLPIEQALAAGRAIGLDEAMIFALHKRGAAILNEVNSAANRPMMRADEAAVNAKVNLERAKEAKENVDKNVAETILTALGINSPFAQELLGKVGGIAGFLWDISKTIGGIYITGKGVVGSFHALGTLFSRGAAPAAKIATTAAAKGASTAANPSLRFRQGFVRRPVLPAAKGASTAAKSAAPKATKFAKFGKGALGFLDKLSTAWLWADALFSPLSAGEGEDELLDAVRNPNTPWAKKYFEETERNARWRKKYQNPFWMFKDAIEIIDQIKEQHSGFFTPADAPVAPSREEMKKRREERQQHYENIVNSGSMAYNQTQTRLNDMSDIVAAEWGRASARRGAGGNVDVDMGGVNINIYPRTDAGIETAAADGGKKVAAIIRENMTDALDELMIENASTAIV